MQKTVLEIAAKRASRTQGLLRPNIGDGADSYARVGQQLLGFALKTLNCMAVLGYCFGEKLQGGKATQGGVFGPLNDTHASSTALFCDSAVRNGLVDHGESLRGHFARRN